MNEIEWMKQLGQIDGWRCKPRAASSNNITKQEASTMIDVTSDLRWTNFQPLAILSSDSMENQSTYCI